MPCVKCGNALYLGLMRTALHEAAHLLNGQSRLAEAIGVKPPTLQQWLNGKRPVPDGKCAAIEKATGGRVTVDAISPGGWARIPDSTWPNPAGRPVREVVAGMEA